MLVDTVAGLVRLTKPLPAALFSGGTVTVSERGVDQRLYHNSTVGYAPRVTYWPKTDTLRVEWSLQHLSLDEVDHFLAGTFGELPPVRTWACQRVDYCADLDVGERLPVYLALVSSLRLSTWERHPFQGQGVVWKSGTRWVKFYDKGRERGTRESVLRFEVSNYRDAVVYMSERWFGCRRTVGEMVEPGRAAYCLAYYWCKLGLHKVQRSEDLEVQQLRAVFGPRRVASARHALQCIRAHGAESYKSLALISKSSYYRWLNELRTHGFLSSSDVHTQVELHLPIENAFPDRNLKRPLPGVHSFFQNKNVPEIWPELAKNFGLNPKSPVNPYFLERFYGAAAV